MESFGTSAHDDIADATHRAFNTMLDTDGADAYLTFLGGQVQELESKGAKNGRIESGRRIHGGLTA